ncbi:MAG: GNAT family N-acetyltransferase, partial [Planctomycetota bacterium]
DRFAYVAMEGERLVGFADMDHEGYIDRLFVSADHQRMGFARQLFERLIQDALRNDILEMTTEASITARPFFQSMGFEVEQKQSVICRGVALTNYRMRKFIQE